MAVTSLSSLLCRSSHSPLRRHGSMSLARERGFSFPFRQKNLRTETELEKSKAVIEDALSAPIACIAYPYGRFDDAISFAPVPISWAWLLSAAIPTVWNGSTPIICALIAYST